MRNNDRNTTYCSIVMQKTRMRVVKLATGRRPDGTPASRRPHGSATIRWGLYSSVRHLSQSMMGAVHNSNNEVRDYSPQVKHDMVITPLMERLMQWDDNRFEVFEYRMENEHARSCFPRPTAVYCLPTVRLSSERTVTDKRTRLHGCLELGDNLHFSIAGNCMRKSGN